MNKLIVAAFVIALAFGVPVARAQAVPSMEEQTRAQLILLLTQLIDMLTARLAELQAAGQGGGTGFVTETGTAEPLLLPETELMDNPSTIETAAHATVRVQVLARTGVYVSGWEWNGPEETKIRVPIVPVLDAGEVARGVARGGPLAGVIRMQINTGNPDSEITPYDCRAIGVDRIIPPHDQWQEDIRFTKPGTYLVGAECASIDGFVSRDTVEVEVYVP